MNFEPNLALLDPTPVGGWLSFLGDSLAKGLVGLVVALIAALVLARRGAATRHLVWFLGLACALLLPLGAWLLPKWEVVPVSWDPRQVVAAEAKGASPAEMPPVDRAELGFERVEVRVTFDTKSVPDAQAPAPERVEPVQVGPDLDPAPAPSGRSAVADPSAESLATAPEPGAGFTLSRIDLRWPLVIWMAGVMWFGFRLVRSWVSLWRVTSRGTELTSGAVLDQVEAMRRQIGLDRSIDVLLGSPGSMPMVWGIFRARLILPEEALGWSEGRLRAILLHELAHLRRRDPLCLLIGNLAAIWHWPNPLAWLAVRRLRAEAERACDDAVLRQGVRASDYASHVLDFSLRSTSSAMVPAALMMGRPSGVELRIHEILDASRSRRAPDRRTCGIAATIAFCFAITVAILGAKQEVEPDAPVRIASLNPEISITVEPESQGGVGEVAIAEDFAARGRSRAATGDLAALLTTVNAVQVVAQRQAAASGAIRGAAEQLPREALNLLPQVHIRDHFRRKIVADVLQDMLERDVDETAEFVTRNPDGGQVRHRLLIEIAQKLPPEELASNLDWAGRLPSAADCRTGRRFVILAFAKAYPEEVIDRLRGITETGEPGDAWTRTGRKERIEIVNTAYASIREESDERAREWLLGLPVLSELPSDWLQEEEILEDPEDQLARAMTFPEGSVRRVEHMKRVIPAIAEQDPERALELSLQIPKRDRERPVEQILMRWASADFEAALRFSDDHPLVVRGRALEQLLMALAKRDVAGAEEALRRVEDMGDRSLTPGSVRFYALETIAQAGEPGRAMELAGALGAPHVRNAAVNWARIDRAGFEAWLATAPGAHRAPALAGFAFHLHDSDPGAAAEILSGLAEIDLPQTVIYDAQRTGAAVARQLLEQDVGGAQSWVSSLAGTRFGGPPARVLMREWLETDRRAPAIRWMSSLPEGPGRDGAAITLLEVLAGADPHSYIPRHYEDVPGSEHRSTALEKKILTYVSRLEVGEVGTAKLAVGAIRIDPAGRQRIEEALKRKEQE